MRLKYKSFEFSYILAPPIPKTELDTVDSLLLDALFNVMIGLFTVTLLKKASPSDSIRKPVEPAE